MGCYRAAWLAEMNAEMLGKGTVKQKIVETIECPLYSGADTAYFL